MIMKRVLFFITALIGLWIVISCQKETVVERVEVQKGNIIHSGMGAPDAASAATPPIKPLMTWNLLAKKSVAE